MTDRVKVINEMSRGLKFVDQFRELALSFLGQNPQPTSAVAEQAGDALQIRQYGQITEIQATQLNMNEWDDVKYRALYKRVKFNFDLFYELYSDEPSLPSEERARMRIRMDKIKAELCEDFREMVSTYERALGVGLPDHYTLYEVCMPKQVN